MTLEIPKYIEITKIVGSPITYDWDPQNSVKMYEHNYKLANKIGAVCNRGAIALSAGFAEWIAWRFSKHLIEQWLFLFIEAVWAGIADWRYIKEVKKVPEAMLYLKGKKGLEDFPVKMALALLDEVSRGDHRIGKFGLSSSCISQLALNVMPNPKMYKDWRRFAISRLHKLYPKKEDNVLGPPLPREILDPDFDFQPQFANKLVSNFLEKLDFEKNPFLYSREELLKQGFDGVPYKL